MLPRPNITLMAVYVRIVLKSLGLVDPEMFKEGVGRREKRNGVVIVFHLASREK